MLPSSPLLSLFARASHLPLLPVKTGNEQIGNCCIDVHWLESYSCFHSSENRDMKGATHGRTPYVLFISLQHGQFISQECFSTVNQRLWIFLTFKTQNM